MLRVGNLSGAFRCKLISAPDIDDSLTSAPASAGSPEPLEEENKVAGGFKGKLGDAVVNRWIIIGAVGGACVLLLALSIILFYSFRTKKRKDKKKKNQT